MKKHASGPTTAGASGVASFTSGTGLFDDGSAAAPSIGFASQTGTGFRYVATGGIGVMSSGTELSRFTSGGLSTAGAITFGSSIASLDTVLARAAANSMQFGTSSSVASATSRVHINKAVTAIADNVATATFTVTIPNAAHSASLRVKLKGSAGAGGSIGANESTRSIEYDIDITRTAGVNAVATISAAFGNPAAATVAGGNGLTVTGTLSAISGAVGATNTFTVNVTIARAAGTATNHTCFAYGELINDNASGVTIA